MRRSLILLLALFGTLLLFLVPTASAAGGAGAAFTKTSDWGSGYQGQYTITNGGTTTLGSWKVEFDLPAGSSVGSYWDALLTQSGTHYTFTNRDYNGSIAPGASAAFGWVGAGSGVPANCKLNGGSCAPGGSTGGSTAGSSTGTTSGTTSGTSTGTTSGTTSGTTAGTTTGGSTGGTNPGTGTVRTAPYVDMGAWPTPSLTAMSQGGGIKSFTLGFVTSAGCKASWFNAYDPRQAWAKDQIDAIRAAGGDVKVSFGGASGIELAQACPSVDALTTEYAAVVDAYRLSYVDFDIEGSAVAEPASIALRSQAMARLQQTHPNLRISLTLPVLPEGLTSDGLNVVSSAKNAGVNLDLVNLMAMDYYRSTDYGDAAVQAATATQAQLKSLLGKSDAQAWAMLGVTPMLGQNDDGHVYDQSDARQLVSFAQGKHLGMLSFWEEGRDANACSGALYKCTNIAQAPYDFSKIFAGYKG
ncbi:cellulose binding domain-containing protein [Streptomyces sp. NPDC049040]|uniref:cellulose binding domain-containing protein n=1 Tax=Streptomyces sp. NPDC049040 TaxID=3365593 RepID=UPI00371CE8D1